MLRTGSGRRAGLWAVVPFLLLAGACDDAVVPVPSRTVSVAPAGDRLARSIALAMNDANVRHTMLRAFRASPYVAHRLQLQDFLATNDGRLLLDRAAAAAQLSRAELQGVISKLPRLQLSVGSREDRLTWRGSGNVAVGFSAHRRATRQMFLTDGSAAATLRGSGVVAIHLEPAGHGLLRTDPQAPGAGDVIQDADDGETGVQYVRRTAEGRELLLDLIRSKDGAQRLSSRRYKGGAWSSTECVVDPAAFVPDPSCGSSGGGGLPVGIGTGAGGGWTYITNISSPLDGWGGPEFEFHASEIRSDGWLMGANVVRIELAKSVEFATWQGHVALIFAVANGDGRRIEVMPIETDWLFDDNFVPRSLTNASDYDTRTFFREDVYSMLGMWVRFGR